MRVSICLLTIDRYEETKKTLETNFGNHGYAGDIELLWCDNGSSDQRVIDLVSAHPLLKYSRLNKSNEGVGKAFNQLMLRSTGDFIFLMANDILNPPNWLAKCIDVAKNLPNAGIIGLECAMPPCPLKTIDGITAHFASFATNRSLIFGPMGFTREAIFNIGLFNENYSKYGIEDTCLNLRMHFSGKHCLYLQDMKSEHIGEDIGNQNDYRIMKNVELEKSYYASREIIETFSKDNYRLELPKLRNPIQ